MAAGALLFNAGDNNTATGALALLNNTGGFYNTADGAFALLSNTEGSGNTGSDYQALYSNTSGSNNAAYGFTSLYNNTGSFDTAFGSQTLVYNTTGHSNTAIGYQALVFNNGYGNTASGYFALNANTQGQVNTAVGFGALGTNTTGSDNIALGAGAGLNNTTGRSNIYIHNGGLNETGTIRVGTTGFHTSTYLAGIAGQTVGAGGSTCYVDNDGKLGVFLSARRYKTDIAEMNSASEALLRLRPVTFRYKPEMKATNARQLGLIAEEVAEVNPDLVIHDATGELSAVRYEAVNAMLLNEFLKGHKTVQELKTTLVQQQKQIEALTEGLQKVSAQLELNKPAPKITISKQ